MRAILGALLDKLAVMGGCNEHDMDGPEAWPEFAAARAAIRPIEVAARRTQKSPESIKVTPAMREWCRYLAQPGKGLRRTYLTSGYRATAERGIRKQGLTYVMGLKLEDAGLIKWVNQEGSRIGHVAELTDKGREVAA